MTAVAGKKRGRKTKESEAVGDLWDELSAIEGTQRLSDVTMLHRNAKVRTPLSALNDLFGGGIPLGTIVEAGGDTGAGKSTFCYQTVGLFHADFPDGVAVILDTEASTDTVRMKLQGVNTNRVVRVPATTVEIGFARLFETLAKIKKVQESKGVKIPVLILWDTIGAAITNAQAETGEMNANGMNEKNRILKIELSRVFLEIAQLDVCIILINQASMQGFGTYQGPSLGSSGGQALKHDVHIKLWFVGGKDSVDENSGMTLGKMGKMTVKKSKVSPAVKDIPYWIDSRQGGVILDDQSLWTYAKDLKLVADRGAGWYYLLSQYPPGTPSESITAAREADLYESVFADPNRNAADSLYWSLRNSMTQYFYLSSTYIRHVYTDIQYRTDAWASVNQELVQVLPDLSLADPNAADQEADE